MTRFIPTHTEQLATVAVAYDASKDVTVQALKEMGTDAEVVDSVVAFQKAKWDAKEVARVAGAVKKVEDIRKYGKESAGVRWSTTNRG